MPIGKRSAKACTQLSSLHPQTTFVSVEGGLQKLAQYESAT